MIDTSYEMAYKEVRKVCANGVQFCFKIPLQTIRFCWRTQVYVVTLPFRCSYGAYSFIKCQLSSLLHLQNQNKAKYLLQQLIQNDICDKEKVLKTMNEFRNNSLIAITKMNIVNQELKKLCHQLTKWKSHAERQNRQMNTIVNEEKDLLAVIIGALKRLKTLKIARESVDEKIRNTLDGVLSISKGFSLKDFPDYTRDYPASDVNTALKTGYNKLQKQAEQIKTIIEKRRSITNLNCQDSVSREFLSMKTRSTSSLNLMSDGSYNKLNLSVGALDAMIGLLNSENSQLKKRLKVTNEQLDEVKKTTSCFNEKVSQLEEQLDLVISLLKNVEADRDNMKDKLLTLQGMIEEEEIFLNDDASLDDCFSELFVTTKELMSNEFESPIASPCNFATYGSEMEANCPKSLELSLSR